MTATDTQDDTVVADIPKNRREVLRVSLGEFKGHQLCHLRVWVSSGGPLPTKNGFGIEPTLIRLLREALDRADEEAKRLGWLDA